MTFTLRSSKQVSSTSSSLLSSPSLLRYTTFHLFWYSLEPWRLRILTLFSVSIENQKSENCEKFLTCQASHDDSDVSLNVGRTQAKLVFLFDKNQLIKEQVSTQLFNTFEVMEWNTSFVFFTLLVQLFMLVSSSETTESSSTLPPPDTQAGRCSRNLHQTFDPLMQNVSTCLIFFMVL